MSMPWEELRVRLRQLEKSVEANVTELSRLCEGFCRCTGSFESRSLLEAHVAQANDLNSQILEELERASALIKSIESGRSMSPPQNAQYHRFKQIFTDFAREAHIAFTTIDENYKRRSLLGDHQNVEVHQDESVLLRERNALDTSIEMLNSTISQGSATNISLQRQGTGARGISHKLLNLGSQLPSTNQLLVKIRRAQLKGHIIMAIVTGTCILLLLVYVFRK